jgi:hypothetical protein
MFICEACEAEVGKEAAHCPFCGTDLSSSMTKKSKNGEEEKLAFHYKPPYSVRNEEGIGVPERERFQERIEEELPCQKANPKERWKEKYYGHIAPLILLTVGGNLLTFAFLLRLFSVEDTLCLEWNSCYWMGYLFLSLPLLYIGGKLLNKANP